MNPIILCVVNEIIYKNSNHYLVCGENKTSKAILTFSYYSTNALILIHTIQKFTSFIPNHM